MPLLRRHAAHPRLPSSHGRGFSSTPAWGGSPARVGLCFSPRLPQKALQPANQRALSVTGTSKDGQAPRLTSDGKTAPSLPWGARRCIPADGPTGRVVCTGPRGHSPAPGSGRRHCAVTPGAEGGQLTALLPQTPQLTAAGWHCNHSVTFLRARTGSRLLESCPQARPARP